MKTNSLYPGEVVTVGYKLEDGRLYLKDYKPELGTGTQLGQVVKAVLGKKEGTVDVAKLEGCPCVVVVEKRTTQDGAREYFAIGKVLAVDDLEESEIEEDAEVKAMFDDEDEADANDHDQVDENVVDGTDEDEESEDEVEQVRIPVTKTTGKIKKPVAAPPRPRA